MAKHKASPSDPSPEAASQSPLSTDGVQEAQSGATTDEATEAADRLAAEQADQYRAAQQEYLAELVKRERAAVQAFAGFLRAFPEFARLPAAVERARGDAVDAALSLDEHLALGAGEMVMGIDRG